MLLAVDIGNTSTKFRTFDGELLTSKFSIPTDPCATKDHLISVAGHQLDNISEAIICSVVPDVNASMREFLSGIGVARPSFVTNDLDFGLKVNYEPLSSLGTDRLVNSFSAAEKYGVPCIVCSLGTATTFDAVNKDREFLGGVIAPGMKTMAKALHLNTAALPEIEIEKAENVLGDTTIESIRSGIFYGHVALIEGMIRRIKTEIGDNPNIVATGGFASFIRDNTDCIDIVDEGLLLDGLRLLHERIHPV